MILIFINICCQINSNRTPVLVGLVMLCSAAISLEKLSAQNASNANEDLSTAISLSHIEIQEQFIDYRKLSDPKYREEITFGEALSKTFDSTAAHYNYPVTMQLPHYLNTLTFHFAATDWKAPHKIKYSYYLEGLENEWGNPSGSSMVIYRNLPFGTYTLNVKAIGAAQIWSEPFSYTFSVQRPWWRTWWAYWAYGLILASLGFALVIYWQQRKKKSKKCNNF